MEEARGETFTWNELKENFLKDFKFSSHEKLLVEVSKQIKTFLQPTDNTITIEIDIIDKILCVTIFGYLKYNTQQNFD